MKKKQNNWRKYGSIFAIVIILGSFIIYASLVVDTGGEKAYPLNDVTGTKTNFTLNAVKDGIKYVPEGVLAITVVPADDKMNTSVGELFPGATPSKLMTAIYNEGLVEFYGLQSTDNVSVMIEGKKPKYEKIGDYNVISTVTQGIFAGNPMIRVVFEGTDKSLVGKVANVLSGTSTGAKDFDAILNLADNVSDFEEIMVSKTKEGAQFSMIYQRESVFENGTSQLETIIYGPSAEFRTELKEFSEKEITNITFTATEDELMFKLYINGTDALAYQVIETSLHKLIDEHGETYEDAHEGHDHGTGHEGHNHG